MRVVSAVALIVLVLSGCGNTRPLVSPEEGERIARQCQEQTGAPGTYSLRPGQPSSSLTGRLPRASAVKNLGGTDTGADAINACLLSTVTDGQQRVETVRTGDTRVVTYSYGTPPQQSSSAATQQVPSQPFTPSPTGYCPANASVLYGGTSYCL